MSWTKYLFLTLFLMNCSDNKKESDTRQMGAVQEDQNQEKAEKKSVKLEKVTPESIKITTKDLDVVNGAGSLSLTRVLPKPIFLDSNVLETVFRPIFGNAPRSASAITYFVNNQMAFFTAGEKANLGTFSLHDGLHTKQNTKIITTPTVDYIRSLRSFLTDACTKLVNAESANMAAGNKLVSARKPTAAKVSEFMNRMFGSSSTGLQTGATELANVFASNVGTVDLTTEAGITLSKNNYIMMCVSIGTDIRTFTR